ncbi:MAG: Stk1 family PASTA domain-containing Ser/Thr kinase, partial [Angelakisella sp.]
ACLRRFRDESRAIYSLNHPNIVKIFDVILDSQNPAIVMEYVDGITVKDFIERRGSVSIRVAVSLTVQLLRALQHAHDNGIVHRDIKPQNIMVLADGTIKVMDFGIARFAMSQSRTITSRAIGSVHYTSPEQARGDTVIDHRSDIYSTGVILYEMLAGDLPFEGENPVAVAMKQIEQQPTPLSLINPSIPRGLEEIVQRAMAKHPDDRYQSASEMIADFEQFMQNPQITFGYHQRTPAEASKPDKNYGGNDMTPVRQAPPARPTARRPATPPPEPPRRRERRPVTFLSILLGITCAFIIGTISFVGWMLYQHNPFAAVPEVDMPRLIGRRYEDVIKDKALTHFEFELIEQEYSATYAQGEIYEQYPTAGKSVKEGIRVKVKVSLGQQTATLPNLATEEATSAMAKLSEMGLIPEQELVNSDIVAEGNVVSTQPGANETVIIGSTVKVMVSRGNGKSKVQVPDVTGQDIDTAREILKAKGLEVGSIAHKVSDLPNGVVLAQKPNYPDPVVVGGRVNLTIASDVEVVEGQKTASILCMLPIDIEKSVRLVVEHDGVEILNQMVVPSDKRVVSIDIPGESGTTVIAVKINGNLYHSYTVNFDGEDATYTDLEDKSANFKVE